MIIYVSPSYLISLLFPLVCDMSSYSLRNRHHFLFLPSAICELNALDSASHSCPSVPSFKKSISKRQLVPNYFFTGSRIEQILHAWLRTNCSCLNYTLFSKNIIQNKYCDCDEIENTQHFLFHCARFTAQRQIMLVEVQRYCIPTLNVLLFGDMSLNSHTKCTIFEAVERFIAHSKWFEN